MEGAIVKAIVCSVQNGPYELKDVRIGAMSDDEITVRMVATGICHTDFACTNVNYHRRSKFC
jgi:Zn-dependent alcohol dehydrogenase